jgi:hypothetical protein
VLVELLPLFEMQKHAVKPFVALGFSVSAEESEGHSSLLAG